MRHAAGPIRGNRISLRVSILASGSSGNCTLLETSQTRLLVDAGLGKKETLRRLAAVERSVDRLDGIVISHEHSDHIGGLGPLLAQWRTTTVYITAETHAETLHLLSESHAKRLERILGQLGETSLEVRKNAKLAYPIVQRALLSIAVAARRKE